MAKHNLGYVGRIGNVIHYKSGDQFYSRSAPRKFKQTKATKVAATVFGRASGIASIIRGLLFKVPHNPTDRQMQLRLVSAVLEWLHRVGNEPAKPTSQPTSLTGFSFTGKGPYLRNRWKVDIQVTNPEDGLILISVPAFTPNQSIAVPEDTAYVICTLATGSCDLASGRALQQVTTELTFNFNDIKVPAQTLSMELPTPRGALIVTGISLVYKIQKTRYVRTNTDKLFMPAEIVHAIYL
jgi:hypothetical protein